MDNIDEWMNRALNEAKTSSSDSKTQGQAMPQKATPQAGFQQRGAGAPRPASAGSQGRAMPTGRQAQAPLSPHSAPSQGQSGLPLSANAKRKRRKKRGHGGHGQGPGPQQANQQRQPQTNQTAQPQGLSPQKQRQPQHQHRQADRPKATSKPLKKITGTAKPTPILKGKLKIIPLGGLDEVGKNMMAVEYENDIVIIDIGLEFPSEDMFGIDYVVPDVSYLEANKKRIRGVLITHGHLDHIGGLPYILPRLDFPPVFGTKLTMGLAKKRIEEFKQERMAKFMVIDPDKPLKLGQFLCSFFRVAHSIPDAVGIVIDTPVGKIVHTGDFKFDATPARNQLPADIHKMEALGTKNVLALFCESTNALKPGHSMSEKDVGETLEKIVRECPGRIIIASFSSQIGRVQQIIDAAEKNNRKIFVSGRSMRENMQISATLGYLSFKKDLIKDIKQYKKVPDHEALILTTGSQGESVSALTRMAANEHPHLKVKKGDTIVLSSSPIPGNEKSINSVINNLTILGANVIHNQIMDVHASGHGMQDELVRMVNLIKPKYLVPVHGEYYMRYGLLNLAKAHCGIPEERIIMLQNGNILLGETGGIVKKSDETVETKYILIDGLGEGQAGTQVQMDREILSQNGALIVLVYVSNKGKKLNRAPDVVSRGFIYMHESDEITREIGEIAATAYRNIQEKNPGANRQDIKKYIRQTIDKYTHTKLERRPLIIPLIIEV